MPIFSCGVCSFAAGKYTLSGIRVNRLLQTEVDKGHPEWYGPPAHDMEKSETFLADKSGRDAYCHFVMDLGTERW